MHIHHILTVLATTHQCVSALEAWPIQRVNRWLERLRVADQLGPSKWADSSLALTPNDANGNNNQNFMEFQRQKAQKEIYEDFEEKRFLQPLNHFSDEHANTWFGQRYWVNSRHYKAGGPIIVLDGGETSGEGKLPM